MKANIAPLIPLLREAAVTLISRDQAKGTFKPDVDPDIVADNCFAIYYNAVSHVLMELIPIKESRKLLQDRLAVQLMPYVIVSDGERPGQFVGQQRKSALPAVQL